MKISAPYFLYNQEFGIFSYHKKHWVNPNCQNSEPTKRTVSISDIVKICEIRSGYFQRFFSYLKPMCGSKLCACIRGKQEQRVAEHIVQRDQAITTLHLATHYVPLLLCFGKSDTVRNNEPLKVELLIQINSDLARMYLQLPLRQWGVCNCSAER